MTTEGRQRRSLRERRAIRGEPGKPAAEHRGDGAVSLAETLDRVLAKGVVAQAEVVLSVAEIPLVYVGLQALVSSFETAAQVMSEEARP